MSCSVKSSGNKIFKLGAMANCQKFHLGITRDLGEKFDGRPMMISPMVMSSSSHKNLGNLVVMFVSIGKPIQFHKMSINY